MAIDAMELRIGNWVKYEKYFCKVDAICDYLFEDSKNVSITGDGIGAEIKFEDINPIPLTPDILIACGLDKGIGGHVRGSKTVYKYHLTTGIYIMENFDNNKVSVFVNPDMFGDGEAILEIEHLHQLQNLYYSLTNSELKINL